MKPFINFEFSPTRLLAVILLSGSLLITMQLGLKQVAATGTTYTIGTTPCNTTIQACINLANNGDTILIPTGTYTESLALAKAVNLTGAGQDQTILRAPTNQRVIEVSGVVISNTAISRLTITGGRTMNDSGAGIFVYSQAQLTLDEVAIKNNHSSFSAGGLLNNAVVTLTNSIVTQNIANGSGGGGGIESGCVSGCRIYIHNTTISSNIITGLPSFGGGIYNSSVAELINATVSGNNGRQGVGIANFGSTSVMTVTNSTISGNGIQNLPNSNYVGVLNFGSITLNNSTVSNNGNASVTVSGGIHNSNSQTGSFVLRNTIVANNIGGNCSTASVPFVDEGGNIQFGPNTGCVSSSGEIFSGDPKLQALASNGGPTSTMAIIAGSAAINNGITGLCPAKDQRTYNRPDACDSGAFEYGGIAPFRVFLPVIQK